MTSVWTERALVTNSVKNIDVGRQTRTNLDNAEESRINDSWNIEGHGIFSGSWSGSTRFRILNKRPPQGYSWVDGRLTKNTIHIETGNDLDRSVATQVHVCSKESKAAVGY